MINPAVNIYLKIIFFAHLFERFSYYGVRTLLILFLTQQFQLTDAKACSIIAFATMFTFCMPAITSYLSDKFFGYKATLLFATVLCITAQFCICLSSLLNNHSFFFFSIILLAIGTGYYKNNVINLFASFYDKNVQSKLHGLTIIHIGANIGSAISQILNGYIAYYYGYSIAFIFSACGIVISAVILFFYNSILPDNYFIPILDDKKQKFFLFIFFVINFIVAFLLTFILLKNFNLKLIYYFVIASFAIFFYVVIKTKEFLRLFISLIIMISSMLFSIMDAQVISIITLFAKRNIANNIYGYAIPSNIFHAINPITVVIVGMLLSRKNKEISIMKIFLGICCIAIAFFVLYLGCLLAINYKVHYLYLVAAIVLTGIGEVIFMPFVQSMIISLAPRSYKGFMLSFAMLVSPMANLLHIIYVSKILEIPKINGQINQAVSLTIYTQNFLKLACYSGLVIFFCAPLFYLIKKVSLHK